LILRRAIVDLDETIPDQPHHLSTVVLIDVDDTDALVAEVKVIFRVPSSPA